MGALRIHVRFYISQALSSGQLGHEQGNKLIPAADLAQFLTAMVMIGQGLKFMSRDQLEELRENCAMMRQGLNPPVITVFGRTSIVSTRWDLSLFNFDLWDSSGDRPIFKGQIL